MTKHFQKNRHLLLMKRTIPLAEKKLLNGMQFHGYFIDAGTRDSWNQAVSRCISESRFVKGSRYQNSWFGNTDEITDMANITQSMVDSGSTIEASTVAKSTILGNSIIGRNCTITNSLIGRNCRIGDNCVIENAILDHQSEVPSGTTIIDNTWPIGNK